MTGDNVNPITSAIEGAEEIHDPLDGLVERVTPEPGAAFLPEGVAPLREL